LIYLNDTRENTTEICLGYRVKLYKAYDINLWNQEMWKQLRSKFMSCTY